MPIVQSNISDLSKPHQNQNNKLNYSQFPYESPEYSSKHWQNMFENKKVWTPWYDWGKPHLSSH